MRPEFAKLLVLSALLLSVIAINPVRAQEDDATPKAGKALHVGDILSGELNAMRVRGGEKGQRIVMYQLVSEPRRLPAPAGLCGLETGPETFQLVPSGDAQAKQLKSMLGKDVSITVDEVACAQEAGQMSEAVVTRWALLQKHTDTAF